MSEPLVRLPGALTVNVVWCEGQGRVFLELGGGPHGFQAFPLGARNQKKGLSCTPGLSTLNPAAPGETIRTSGRPIARKNGTLRR